MALLPQLTRHLGQPLFLPAHGRGAALPDGLRQLLRRRAGVWDLPDCQPLAVRWKRTAPSQTANAPPRHSWGWRAAGTE